MAIPPESSGVRPLGADFAIHAIARISWLLSANFNLRVTSQIFVIKSSPPSFDLKGFTFLHHSFDSGRVNGARIRITTDCICGYCSIEPRWQRSTRRECRGDLVFSGLAGDEDTLTCGTRAGRWWRDTGFVPDEMGSLDVWHLFHALLSSPFLNSLGRTIIRNDDRQLWIAILQIHNYFKRLCGCVIYNAYN